MGKRLSWSVFASFLLCVFPVLGVEILSGVIKDENNQPLNMAFIMVEGQSVGKTVEKDGSFQISPVNFAQDKYLVIYCENYETERVPIIPNQFIEVKLRPQIKYQIKVVASSSISSEEKKGAVIQKMDTYDIPGTASDPILTANILPGINTAPDTSDLLIRGGAPDEVGYYYDGIEILHPFQLESSSASYFSVFDNQIIDKFNIVSSGFEPRFGNCLSGVMDITSIDEAFKKNGGLGLSIFGASGYYATPIGNKWGAVLSGKGDFSDILTKINGNGNVSYGNINQMGNVFFNANENSKLKLSWIYNKYNINQNDNFKTNSNSNMISLSYQHIFNNVLFSKLSAAYIDYQSKMILSDIDLTKSFFDKAPQIHWDNILTIGSQEINFGMDYMYRKETIGLDYQNEDSQWMANAHRWGAYGGTHWTVMTKLFTEIGFRINQLKAKNHSVVSFDPRLSMAYMLNQNHIIRFSTGLYHQFGDLFSHQDYDLKPKEAFHAALGYDYTSDQNHFRFSVYDKEYQNLFLNENDAVTNNGKGFARGFELYFLRNLNKMKWIVLYNFLNSKRREGDILELTTSKYQISHSVTLVFSYEFQSFSVGLRGSYAAGMPFTPLSDVMFDENSQSYIPMYGAPNSQQLPTFTRVDLNIKKNFSIGKRFFVAYLGVVNCFNRKNIQQYDFNSQTGQMDPFYSIFQRSFYMGFYVPFF